MSTHDPITDRGIARRLVAAAEGIAALETSIKRIAGDLADNPASISYATDRLNDISRERDALLGTMRALEEVFTRATGEVPSLLTISQYSDRWGDEDPAAEAIKKEGPTQ